MQSDTSHLRAALTAVFVTVLWSSSWILVRVGLDDEDLAPLTFAGLRYTLAALVLLAWSISNPRHRVSMPQVARNRWKPLMILGVVYYTITQGAQFMAIDAQPAATSSLMLAPTALLGGPKRWTWPGEIIRQEWSIRSATGSISPTPSKHSTASNVEK